MNQTLQRRKDDRLPARQDQTLQRLLRQAKQTAAYQTETMLLRASILTEMEQLRDQQATLEMRLRELRQKLSQTLPL